MEEMSVDEALWEPWKLEVDDGCGWVSKNYTKRYRHPDYPNLTQSSRTPTLFMVDSPSNDLHLQRLKAEGLWYRPCLKKRLRNDHPKHPGAKDRCPIDKSIVAALVTRLPDLASFWELCQVLSERAEEYSFYDGAIKTAAHLVNMIFTEDMLADSAPRHKAEEQLEALCDEIVEWETKNWTCDNICEAIANLVSDKKSYSALTEPDVDFVAKNCLQSLSKARPLNPSCTLKGVTFCSDENTNSAVDYVDYVSSILKGLDLSRNLSADEYTRILILIARGEYYDVAIDLWHRVSKEFTDTDDPQKLADKIEPTTDSKWANPRDILESPSDLSIYLMHCMDLKMLLQLDVVTETFIEFGKSRSLSIVDIDLLEVIEVAELRRHALGDRFISRAHFVWSFYECGYGLPSNIRVFHINDNDQPPYHLYIIAFKLAASLGVKEMKLVHFIFPVLYLEDMEIDGKLDPDLCNSFGKFLEEVTLDLRTRPCLSQRCDTNKDFVEELDLAWMKKKLDTCYMD